MQNTIQFIKEKSKEFNSGTPMDFEYFDDRISQLYTDEEKFAKVIGYFTCLSIMVACLGLFGMSLFVFQQRVKEIGIRKVLGASSWNVFYTISKEFIMLVFISSIISVPIAIYFISGWLQNFAYQIEIGATLVMLTVATALIITIVTIGFRITKVVNTNPVESLRYE